VTADSDGAYIIPSVQAGTYTITVTLEGFDPGAISTVTVTNANVSGKNLTLVQTGVPAFTVDGTITTNGSADGEGASIQLKLNGTPVGAPMTAGTGGAYAIPSVQAGTYTIDVSLAGYDDGAISGVTVTNADVSGADLQLAITTYAITYHLNTGTNGANPASYNAEDLPLTLADPSRTGWFFGGWYDNAEFTGEPVTEIPLGAAGPRAFWAKWTTIVDAQTPVISGQPAGGTYTANAAATLTVTAGVTDGGTLSYQWFSNGANSSSGGTATGGTSASYAPPTATAGTVYYYVVVTNTNTAVNGAQTAQAVSNTAAITVTDASVETLRTQLLGLITAATTAKNAVTVNAAWTEGQLYAPGAYFAVAAASLPAGLYSLNPSPVPAYGTAIAAAQTVYDNGGATAADLITATENLQTAGAAFASALTSVTEGTLDLAARIAAADSGTTVYLYADETFAAVSSVNINNKALTLKGVGAERTVQLTGQGYMFYIRYSNAHLTLDDNVTLRGVTDNTVSLVYTTAAFTMKGNAHITGNISDGDGGGVYSTGTFTMQGNARITGNSAGTNGGGVYTTGTFTMQGNAVISGNTTIHSATGSGGGVYSDGGAFTMQGSAAISGNTATATVSNRGGGGVFFSSGIGYSIFTMKDNAVISDNAAAAEGGGVYFDGGKFIMQGSASVRDNTVTGTGGGVFVSSGSSDPYAFTMQGSASVSGNTAGYYGGGVYVSFGIFIMEGGAVSGNSSDKGGGVYISTNSTTFVKKGGTIYGDTDATYGNGFATDNTAASGQGHAVCAASYTDVKVRNSDAGPAVKLYAKCTYASNVWTWSYDGTSVDGINMDTTPNWTNP
jgi:uncharacterized repeat protein (TIGR02543 family)